MESQIKHDSLKKSTLSGVEDKKEVVVYNFKGKGAEKSSMMAPLVQQIIADNEHREKLKHER